MTRPVNLGAQATSLATFRPDKLARFGGRYRAPLGGMYRVARECVLALLGEPSAREDPEVDAELFSRVINAMPPGHELATTVRLLGELRPFRYEGQMLLPFDPAGDTARERAAVAWEQAASLLVYATATQRDREVGG